MQPCTKERDIQEIRDMVISHNISFDYVKKSIETIETNHLTHIQASLENMESRINNINITIAKWVGGGIVLFTIAQVLISYFIKKL